MKTNTKTLTALLLLIALGILPRAFSQQIFTDPGNPSHGAPKWHIEKVPVKHVKTTSTVRVTIPGFTVTEWVVNAPCAPALDQQTVVSNLAIQWYAGHPEKAQEGSDLKRPVLRADIRNENGLFSHGITTYADYDATLYSRRLVSGPPTTPPKPLSDEDRKCYTASTITSDQDAPAFRDFLQSNKIWKGSDDEITFARKVFRFIRAHGKYQLIHNQDRRASVICQSGVTDCGGFSNLYVAILRANDIPARTLAGRMITKEHASNDPASNHVRAEFYAQGIGWIPVDVTFGIGDPTGSEEKYFGSERGDLLVMHVGTDLVLDTIGGKKLSTPWMQLVRTSAVGRGASATDTTDEKWTVENLPLTTVQ